MPGVIEVVNKYGGKLFTTADQNMPAISCRFTGGSPGRLAGRADLRVATRTMEAPVVTGSLS